MEETKTPAKTGTKEAIAEARNTAKTTVKNVEKKVKEAAKEAAQKVVAKTAEKKPAAKKAEEKKPAAKKTTVRKAAAKKAPKTSVILQYSGKEVQYADLIKKATQLSKKTLKKDLKDIKVYVKPEENMAYYVTNNGEDIGSFQI